MHPSERAKDIIEKIKYITIATISEDDSPWNAPVYFAFDEEFTFFWGSHAAAQHSKNIAKNSKVFIVIYDSTVQAGKGEGVYMQADAAMITNPAEKDKAHELIGLRRHPIPYWKREEFEEPTPLALYKAKPHKVWINGEDRKDGHYIDIRTKVNLDGK